MWCGCGARYWHGDFPDALRLSAADLKKVAHGNADRLLKLSREEIEA
jgi:predicted TIM-barrel fold metal-dependent hydrolase